MKKIDLSIQRFNMVFTDTMSRLDFRNVGYNPFGMEINYNNCINLYDLVEKFNRMYISFKKEYEKLDKFDIGKHIVIRDYGKVEEKDYRVLSMQIDKPNQDKKEYTVLYLTEEKGVIKSYLTNDINPSDKKYYFKEISLDEEKVRKYLDLFEKYSLLLYLYKRFKGDVVFSDGTYTIFSEIISENGEFLDDLGKFIISLGAIYYREPGDHINISINLGNNITVNEDESKFVIADETMEAKENDYLELLRKVYLNDRYLNNYWDRVDHIDRVDSETISNAVNSIR